MTAPHPMRLLIAAATLADADAALALARTILEGSTANPSGLLIETGTAAIVTGTRHRVVSATGALVAIPSRETERRIAAREARELETRLASLARPLSRDWSCRVTMGDVVTCACAEISGEDILLLGQRPMMRPRGKVLLLGSGGAVSAPARALAEALARTASATVAEVGDGAEDILSRIDRSHALAVVADFAAGPLTSADDLRRLLAAARCPVAVLGASHIVTDQKPDPAA